MHTEIVYKIYNIEFVFSVYIVYDKELMFRKLISIRIES